ncbi:hypothetical protein NVP1081O_021 [Vibrio phage 1.081.O._10N.286.52.C2]|nr:hypothetical protein NVP1081O_021 [Vibrio phage 1.081.O._10N.286.52.C2]
MKRSELLDKLKAGLYKFELNGRTYNGSLDTKMIPALNNNYSEARKNLIDTECVCFVDMTENVWVCLTRVEWEAI